MGTRLKAGEDAFASDLFSGLTPRGAAIFPVVTELLWDFPPFLGYFSFLTFPSVGFCSLVTSTVLSRTLGQETLFSNQ